MSQKIKISNLLSILITIIMAVFGLIKSNQNQLLDFYVNCVIGNENEVDDFLKKRSAMINRRLNRKSEKRFQNAFGELKGFHSFPIILAAECEQWDIVNKLVANNANLKLKDSYGNTSLIYAVLKRADISIISKLGSSESIINKKNKDGATALLFACQEGYVEIVNYLLEHGANPSAADKQGRTPLWSAAREGNDDIVTLLLKYGVDIEACTKNGSTPVMISGLHNNFSTVKILLDAGANPNKKYLDGKTVLFDLVDYGYEEMLDLFRTYGLDESVKDNNGKTAFDYEQEYKDTFTALEQLGEAGNVFIQSELGTMYLNGSNVKKDLEKAFYWLSKAAESNDVDALGNLGMMYFKGDFVEKNYDKANEIWMRGVELEDPYCLYNIGVNYLDGLGFDVNKEKAYEYLQKASDLGSELARLKLESLKLKNLSLKNNSNDKIDEKEIDEVLKIIDDSFVPFISFEKVMRSENAQLLNIVAKIYEEYDDSYQEKAFALYSKSAELGNEIGVLNKAYCLLNGIGCERNLTSAFFYFKIMAEKNDHFGLYDTGVCYLNGEGIAKDSEKAIYYLEKACEHNCNKAYFLLGTIYFNGEGVEKNKNIAKECLLHSIKLGNRDALDFYNTNFSPYDGVFEEIIETFPKQLETRELSAALSEFVNFKN